MTTFNRPPLIGLGTYPLAGEQAAAAVRIAIDVGIRHIDTAQMYRNERAVGKGIMESGIARNELYVVTKVDPGNAGAGTFEQSVERSVDDLGGSPDLLLIHWPPAKDAFDAVIDRLVYAKSRGWAKAIGVSNFTPGMMKQAQTRANGDLVCNQVEFHPMLDQRKILAAARELDMTVTAYSPVARGATFDQPVVRDIAARLGRPESQIVLRWIVQQGVSAIPMTRQRAHAASNLAVLDFELPPDDMSAISMLHAANRRTINPGWMTGRWNE